MTERNPVDHLLSGTVLMLPSVFEALFLPKSEPRKIGGSQKAADFELTHSSTQKGKVSDIYVGYCESLTTKII
jgi:hypothetical protein